MSWTSRRRSRTWGLGRHPAGAPRPPSSPCTAASSTSCRTSTTSRASGTTRSSSPTTASTLPTTWDEFVAAAAKLKAAGVTPFSASGKQGWPLTRLVSGYLFRDLGPDALQKVADGQAKLTDPEYVKAAASGRGPRRQGLLRQGRRLHRLRHRRSQFLTGKAAMFYMGSWALANFNDKAQNKIGAENIGFMPFPTVAGGKGIERPVRRQRRPADDLQRQDVRRQGRRLAQVHRQATTAAPP